MACTALILFTPRFYWFHTLVSCTKRDTGDPALDTDAQTYYGASIHGRIALVKRS